MAGLFVVLSLTHLFFTSSYYHAVKKTQFREMTRFITQNNAANYPIINELTYWHQGYYLKKMGSKAIVLTGNKESILDSIISKSSPKYDLQGFWIAGAHGDKKPGETILKRLDTAYILVKQSEFYNAWATLYISKYTAGKEYISIKPDQFEGGAFLPADGVIAIWNGAIRSKPVSLPKGKYRITITAKGDMGGDQYPHLNVYINDIKTGDYYVSGDMAGKSFDFDNTGDSIILKVEMDNDFAEPGKGDRNAFIGSVLIELLR
jgi:hypothetical protein